MENVSVYSHLGDYVAAVKGMPEIKIQQSRRPLAIFLYFARIHVLLENHIMSDPQLGNKCSHNLNESPISAQPQR